MAAREPKNKKQGIGPWSQKGPWMKVIFADDLPLCDDCSEPYCPQCDCHYDNCDCPGPTEDNVEYKEVGGVLYGRRVAE